MKVVLYLYAALVLVFLGALVWVFRRKDDPMKKAKYVVEFYRGVDKDYRWRVKHRNGNLVACCGEGYRNKLVCRTVFRHVFAGIAAGTAEVVDLCNPKK